MPRSGRRRGESGARGRILGAARHRFAVDGYRGATIRAIAADAGVDPALVHHYFGTKQGLFAAVLDVPFSPALVLDVLEHTPAEHLGERLLVTFLGVWEQPEHRQRLQIVLGTAVADPGAARMFREFVMDELLVPVAARIGAGEPELRAALVASQLAGFAFLRYVLRIEPLASAPRQQIVAAYAPTLQRYFTGSLSGTAPPDS